MQLLFRFATKKLIYLVIFLAIGCIGNTKASSKEASELQQVDNKTNVTTVTPKTVKKELKVKLAEQSTEEIAPALEKDNETAKAVISETKSLVKGGDKGLVKEVAEKNGEEVDNAETVTKPNQHQQFLEEDFVLSDEDDVTETLKTGFYFFLLLSSGAIVLIIFKIYRLRLSRAERKYGVQGDRSAQELTPLPISVEDDHSDDEDQTLFEIQRQNIRIL